MLEAYIDGACEPVNPGGTASYGVVVLRHNPKDAFVEELSEVGFTIPSKEYQDGDVKVWEGCGIVGSGPQMSNNVAEYAALVELLEWMDNQVPEDITILSDSKLLVNQMNFDWEGNKSKLYFPYYQKAIQRRMSLGAPWGDKTTFKWIPREQNLADRLSVEALAEVGIVRRR